MREMIIKKFETSDLPALAELYLQERQKTFHWMPKESFKLYDFFKDTLNEEIYVIYDRVVAAGFISLWMPDNFIHHLYIDSHYHKKGYGKKLLDHALNILGRPASLKCVVRNDNAVQFYKSQGWKVDETGKDIMGPYYLMILE